MVRRRRCAPGIVFSKPRLSCRNESIAIFFGANGYEEGGDGDAGVEFARCGSRFPHPLPSPPLSPLPLLCFCLWSSILWPMSNCQVLFERVPSQRLGNTSTRLSSSPRFSLQSFYHLHDWSFPSKPLKTAIEFSSHFNPSPQQSISTFSCSLQRLHIGVITLRSLRA